MISASFDDPSRKIHDVDADGNVSFPALILLFQLTWKEINLSDIRFEQLLRKKKVKTDHSSTEESTALLDPIKDLKDHIYYAKEELVLSSDVLHRLLLLDQATTETPPLVGCTFAPAKPGSNPTSLISNSELAMSWKLTQLESATKYLTSQYELLSETLEQEKLFYSEFCALLFANNWFLQRHAMGKGLFVDYSHVNVGSRFQEIGMADVVRDGKNARFVLNHAMGKRLSIRYYQPGARNERDQQSWLKRRKKLSGNVIIQQLESARETIFENELFGLVFIEELILDPT
jgi:hypothetical protein